MVGEELPSLPPLTALHWFFVIQIFEQLSCPEKQSCPENFHCVEIFFIFQDFWATCASPEKQSVPWIHCIEYIFLITQNFEQLALALRNRVYPEIFHCIEIFFIFQDFWATWACPENRVCPEFFKPGGRPPPRPRLVSHWLSCSSRSPKHAARMRSARAFCTARDWFWKFLYNQHLNNLVYSLVLESARPASEQVPFKQA